MDRPENASAAPCASPSAIPARSSARATAWKLTVMRVQNMRIDFLFPSIFLAASALAALKGNAFTPPAGCTAFLTVQSRSCIVTHYWRCEGEPTGQKWSLMMDETGPVALHRTDAEFRWLETYRLKDQLRELLITPEEDPASLSELLETGTDSASFSQEIRFSGRQIGIDRITGFDKLTGESIEIDGETLLRTEFAYSVSNSAGMGSYEVSGRQFVSPRLRIFFGGIETREDQYGKRTDDYSPVEFSFPGEEGFLANTPKYDCGATLSALPQRNAMKEQDHEL